MSLTLVYGVAPLGTDSQHLLRGASSIRLGDVCGRHYMDYHHHPLPHDAVKCPPAAFLRPLAHDGRKE